MAVRSFAFLIVIKKSKYLLLNSFREVKPPDLKGDCFH